MAKFEFNSSKVLLIYSDMPQYTKDIKSYSSSVESIKKSLAINASYSETIKNNLGRTIENLQSHSTAMNELATNLSAINDKYCETENRILDNGVLADFVKEDTSGTSESKAIESINLDDVETIPLAEGMLGVVSGISIADAATMMNSKANEEIEKPVLKEGEVVTKEQEEQMDNWIQQEIDKIYVGYLLEYEQAKTYKDKLEVLKKYAKEVAGIMGISLDDCEFSIEGSISMGEGTAAFTSPNADSIVFNLDWMECEDINMLKYVVHEVRHCYQIAVVNDTENSYVVTQKTKDKWKKGLNNEENGKGSYILNPAENDAFSIAGIGNEQKIADCEAVQRYLNNQTF